MGCELSKGREKELSGKGCIQIDLAIQIDLFISIHARILSFFWSHLQELQRNEDILQTLQPQLILLGPQLPQDMVAQLPKCRTLMLEKAQVAWTKRKRKAWQLLGLGFEVFQACSSLWLGNLAFLSNFHRILQSVTVEESSTWISHHRPARFHCRRSSADPSGPVRCCAFSWRAARQDPPSAWRWRSKWRCMSWQHIPRPFRSLAMRSLQGSGLKLAIFEGNYIITMEMVVNMGWSIHTITCNRLKPFKQRRVHVQHPLRSQNATRIECCSILQCFGQPVPLDRSTSQSVAGPHCALPTPWTRCSRVKGLMEIPWRNNKKHHKFHITFWLFKLHMNLYHYYHFLSISSNQKKSTAVSDTISQPNNHQPIPGVHSSTSSDDPGLCTEFLGGVATLGGVNDSLDFHLGWRDACSLGSTLAEWRWCFQGALGGIIDQQLGDGVMGKKEGVRILHEII